MKQSCRLIPLGELLEKLSDYPYVLVNEKDSLPEIGKRIRTMPGVRSIYVVDHNNRVIGAISPSRFIRTIMSPGSSYEFSVRNLMDHITCNCASDIMDDHLVYALPTEPIQTIIKKMLQREIKEIPVLDDQGRIIKNVGLLELWHVIEPECLPFGPV